MSDNSKIDNVVDTTDCLEAIGACKGMKNLTFIIILICMLLLQGVFWLNNTGYIDSTQETAEIVQPIPPQTPDQNLEPETKAADIDATTDDTQADKVVAEVEAEQNKPVEENAKEIAAEEEAEVIAIGETAEKNFTKYLIPKYDQAVLIIRISNFALILAATLYCLVLLISLKISLVGRLGGISHISRAFFLSLIALVILMPWQLAVEGVCLGAIYTPAELFSDWPAVNTSDLACKILYYLRFSGMWLLVLLLILSAQCRSRKWAKTILRRLGVIR